MNDINIINGTIVRPEGCEKADIGIRGGKIVSVNKPGSLTEAAEKTIDASGLYVFPGMIDTHVHIRGGILSHRESFASGTQAAASGGITTIMEMPIANPPASTPEAFDARRKEIGEQAYVDFCMYGGAGSDNLDQIELLTSHGAAAYKTFLMPPVPGREKEFYGLCSETTEQLTEVMERVAAVGGVLCCHSELNEYVAPYAAKLINGLGAIKKMEHLCAPMLIIWLIVMLIWARTTAGSWGPMVNAKMTFATTAEFVAFFVVSLNSNISYWCSMPLTVTDFTKAAKDQRSQEVGQLLGIPTGMFLLALVGALVSSCTIVIFGHVITDPVALTSMIGHPALIVGMMLFLIIATLTTNVAANALTPAVAIVHLTNGKLNFKWAAVVLCAIGVAIRPWVLINDMGLYMNFFLNGGGALLGPVVGVTICHYFFVCRTELDVRSLYVPEGESMFLNIKKYNKPTYIIIWAMSAIMLLIAQLAPASWQTATCTLGCSMRFSMNAMAIICIALGYLVFRKREGGINSLSYLTLAISFVIIFLGLWIPAAHWLYDASFIVGTLLGMGIYVLLMRVCDKDFMVKKAAEHKAAKAEEANA